ncbi:hypothetical protein [Kordiimonas sp.]|uniref:hypothetical protein n=1 Tax=Kordiimonas sp. TaxID=1970157 RepID=UPI003A8FD385
MIRTNTAIFISIIALNVGYVAGVFMSKPAEQTAAETVEVRQAFASVDASPITKLLSQNESLRVETERSRQTLEFAIAEIQSIRAERDLMASEVRFYESEWERTDEFLSGGG